MAPVILFVLAAFGAALLMRRFGSRWRVAQWLRVMGVVQGILGVTGGFLVLLARLEGLSYPGLSAFDRQRVIADAVGVSVYVLALGMVGALGCFLMGQWLLRRAWDGPEGRAWRALSAAPTHGRR